MGEQNDRLLMIFTRNPQRGVGKRRLAATVGDDAAFEIYKFLLAHTRGITAAVDCDRQVWYSEAAPVKDLWQDHLFVKRVQQGGDLGERMRFAFAKAISSGYRHIIIIGSDLYDLTAADLEDAFKELKGHEAVIGPAEDGGYYLLGFNASVPAAILDKVFKDKAWGTEEVLAKTLSDLKPLNLKILDERNDVDYYEDIKDHPDFKSFLKHLNA